MNKILGIVLAMFVMAGTAQADATGNNWYLTGQVNQSDYNTDFSLEVEEANGYGFGVGYDINNWLALEITYTDLGDGSIDFLGVNTGAKADAMSYGAWLVVDPTVTTLAGMPLRIIGRAGVVRTDMDLTGFGGSTSVDDTGFAYGGGIGLGISKSTDLTLEYTRRNLDTGPLDVNFDTVSLGFRYHF